MQRLTWLTTFAESRRRQSRVTSIALSTASSHVSIQETNEQDYSHDNDHTLTISGENDHHEKTDSSDSDDSEDAMSLVFGPTTNNGRPHSVDVTTLSASAVATATASRRPRREGRFSIGPGATLGNRLTSSQTAPEHNAIKRSMPHTITPPGSQATTTTRPLNRVSIQGQQPQPSHIRPPYIRSHTTTPGSGNKVSTTRMSFSHQQQDAKFSGRLRNSMGSPAHFHQGPGSFGHAAPVSMRPSITAAATTGDRNAKRDPTQVRQSIGQKPLTLPKAPGQRI